MPDFPDDLTQEDIASPWLRPVGNAPAFPIKDAAQLLSEPGDDQVQIYNQLQQWTRSGLLHTVRPEPLKRTSPALFNAIDLGTALILREMRQLGFRAEGNLGPQVSFACYNGFHAVRNPPPPYLNLDPHRLTTSPVIAAMREVQRGSIAWLFEFTSYIHEQHRQRMAHAVIYDQDHPPRPTDWLEREWLPRGTIMLSLAPVFRPLAEKIFTKGAARARALDFGQPDRAAVG